MYSIAGGEQPACDGRSTWLRTTLEPDIAQRNNTFWRMPYTQFSRAMLWGSWGGTLDDDAGSAMAHIDPRGWAKYVRATRQVISDFERVLGAIVEGTFFDDSGARPIPVTEGDDGLEIDFTNVVRALLDCGEVEEDDVLDDLNCLFRLGELGRNDFTKAMPVVRYGVDYGIPVQLEEVVEIALAPFDDAPFCYLTLFALVALLGCEKSVRRILHPPKRVRERLRAAPGVSIMPTDPANRRLFGRDADAITAEQYSEGRPIELYRGKRRALLLIARDTPTGTRQESYRLNPEDRFWHERLFATAYNDGGEPRLTVRGSEILLQAGYRNPYTPSMKRTLQRSFDAIDKLTTVVSLAVFRDEGRMRSVELRHVVDATPEFLWFDDGTFDYAIHIRPSEGGGILAAFPLFAFAEETNEVVRASRSDLEFESVGRMRVEHRMMWDYIIRRGRQRRTSNTILIDTMFANIGLEGVDRHKRRRMLAVLRRMLDEKRSLGVLDYEWQAEGGRDRAVTLRFATSDPSELPARTAPERGTRRCELAI